ncbi:hypothetical protein [Pleomorphomonas sp. PLEO]|uniref:hypothetical protein n=1 Tax=Pleomorphomonas sp. PLEO TaxID=3239306 RepID=UPI00351DDD2B
MTFGKGMSVWKVAMMVTLLFVSSAPGVHADPVSDLEKALKAPKPPDPYDRLLELSNDDWIIAPTPENMYVPKKYTLIDYAEISAAGIALIALIYFLRNLIKKGIVVVSVFVIRHLVSLVISIYGYFKDMVLQIRQGISSKNT